MSRELTTNKFLNYAPLEDAVDFCEFFLFPCLHACLYIYICVYLFVCACVCVCVYVCDFITTGRTVCIIYYHSDHLEEPLPM